MPRTGPNNNNNTPVVAASLLHKLHIFIVGTCLVIISLSKGLQVSFQNVDNVDDLSFSPPLLRTTSTDKPPIMNDDEIPIPIDKTPKHFSKHDSLHQQSFLSARLQNTLKFKQLYGRGGSQQPNKNMNNVQPPPQPAFKYDIVNGKKTILSHKKYPRVLYFVHIHKSAGSLICQHAFRNELDANYQNNCNVQEDQKCCGGDNGDDTRQAQIEFATHTHWDFVAIERELPESLAPDYYDYIGCIRDSKARYFSHYQHLRRLVPENGMQKGGYGTAAWLMNATTTTTTNNNKITEEYPPPVGAANAAVEGLYSYYKLWTNTNKPRPDPLGSFQRWYEGQPDNWNTRIFCGPKCMSSPKYQISPQLFQYTLQRLDQFRHFVFVEDLKTTFDTMAASYGWKPHDQDFTRNAGNHSKANNNNNNNNATQQQLLKAAKWDVKMSALDDALYEFARRKYHNVTTVQLLWQQPFANQQDVDEYFAFAPRENCTDACCGQCSLYR